jgi:hypothetical protein
MSQKKTSLLNRAHEIWSELDDAQRRLFEIRTGVPVTGRSRRVREARTLKNPSL